MRPDRLKLGGSARGLRTALVLGALAALVVLPEVLSNFQLYVATRVLIFGLFATGYNLVFGYGGMHSLGHAAFFGLGAYVLGLGVANYDLPATPLLVAATVAGAAMGVVWGLLCVRIRGIYLLLLTLGLGQLLWALASQLVSLTGGDNGVANISRAGLPTGSVGFYWLCAMVTVVTLVLLHAFQRSPVGMSIAAMRESALRTAASGYNVRGIGATAFAVSGAVCALAGALNTSFTAAVSPDSLHWLTSATVMVYAIVGGAGFFFGPFLGAGILIVLEVIISAKWSQWTSVLGIIYIVTALSLKEGILGKAAAVIARGTPRSGGTAAAAVDPAQVNSSDKHEPIVARGITS